MRWTRCSVPASIVLICAALPAAAQTQLWADKLGTTSSDGAFACAPDGSGGVFVGGTTLGDLAGPNAGYYDATLARYDGTGNLLWARQFGSASADYTSASAPDDAGGCYLGGTTTGSLGGPFAGHHDGWLGRFDGAGNQLWMRQLGTSAFEEVRAAAPDGAGGVFLAGTTAGALAGPHLGDWDAWIAHYDGAGNQTWIRQFGTSAADHTRAVAPDGSGGFYLGGSTGGDLGGPSKGNWDAWLARYDSTGSQLWMRQFGTFGHDDAWAAAVDGSGGVYVGGSVVGELGGTSAGSADAWLARYDSAGSQLWVRQFGSFQDDDVRFAAPGGSGGVVVSGQTVGNLGGVTSGLGIWLARYDSAGAREWITNLDSAGGPWGNWGNAGASDGAEGVFVCGGTNGNLAGPPIGNGDGFVLRMGPTCLSVPTVYCTAKPNSLGCVPAIAMLSNLSASSGSAGTVVATNVLGGQIGTFFHSTSGAGSMPFHGGFLCMAPPILRNGPLTSGGTAGTCTGSFSEQFNAYIASGADPALVAGAQVWIQNWSRDPAASFGDGLSNAVTATICP